MLDSSFPYNYSKPTIVTKTTLPEVSSMRLQAVICALLFLVSPVLNAQELVSAKVDLINPLFQHQWVRQDANGSIRGRVLLIEASNRLSGRIDNRVVLSRNGKTFYETRTGTDGVFEIKQLPPGTYGLQAISDYTYAAFAIHVLPASETHLPTSIDVYASSLGSKMRQTLLSSTVPGDMQVGQDSFYRDFQTDPIAGQRQFIKGHQIALKNGALSGRVSRPGWSFSEQNLTGNVARILKDGVVVGEAQTTADGRFGFTNVAPGIYDLVVSGASGFAAYKFEAVDGSNSQTNNRKVDVKFVATQAGDSLNVELVQQSEMAVSPEVVQTVDNPPAEEGFMLGGGGFGGGGFGGGSGGGFGGGGAGGAGGGGFAGLAGIAGLAIGVAALSDDDNPTPPSPFGP